MNKRFEEFMEKNDTLGRGDEGNEVNKQQQKEEKLLKDQEYIDRGVYVLNEFKAVRQESGFNEVIRNMTVKEVVCEFDDETPIEETLRNATQQIYEEICNYSQEVKLFKEWIQKKKPLPIKQPAKANQAAPTPLAETLNTQEG